jgi:hypothetical protein
LEDDEAYHYCIVTLPDLIGSRLLPSHDAGYLYESGDHVECLQSIDRRALGRSLSLSSPLSINGNRASDQGGSTLIRIDRPRIGIEDIPPSIPLGPFLELAGEELGTDLHHLTGSKDRALSIGPRTHRWP